MTQPGILFFDDKLDLISRKLITRLFEKGVSIVVVCVGDTRPEEYPEGLDVVLIPHLRSKLDGTAALQVRRVVRARRAAVAFASSSRSLSCLLFATLFTGCKVVGYRGTGARVRPYDPSYYLGILNPRIAKVVCNDASIVEALSRHIPARKLAVIRKPYDLAWVEDALKAPEPLPTSAGNADPFRVITVANTAGRPYKGLRYLLEAMHLVADPTVELTVIGDYDPEMETLAKSGPAGDRIHLLGPQTNPVRYLPSAHLFVLPSTRDLSPRTVREAMACGLPCIITNIPGARDLGVADRTARLVPPADARSLAEAMLFFRQNPGVCRAYGAAGRERIRTDFSPEVYAERYLEIIREAVPGT